MHGGSAPKSAILRMLKYSLGRHGFGFMLSITLLARLILFKYETTFWIKVSDARVGMPNLECLWGTIAAHLHVVFPGCRHVSTARRLQNKQALGACTSTNVGGSELGARAQDFSTCASTNVRGSELGHEQLILALESIR